MVHTVGLIGANGRVGGATARSLVTYANSGKIKLVLFYRESSPLKNFFADTNIELRPIDLNGPVSALEDAVKGINVFIAALGIEALPSEPKLVEALSASSDLVTYIPSTYSTTWDEADEKDPVMGPMLSFMHGGMDAAKAKGLGVTPILVGSYEDYFFEYGFNGSPIKSNTVWANSHHLKNKFPITTIAHIAEGIASVVSRDPLTIKDKDFSFVTFWPTGQELVDLYTKLNGKQAQVKNYTSTDREEMMANMAEMGPLKAGYWDHWEKENWGYERNGTVLNSVEYDGPSLEEVAKRFV